MSPVSHSVATEPNSHFNKVKTKCLRCHAKDSEAGDCCNFERLLSSCLWVTKYGREDHIILWIFAISVFREKFAGTIAYNGGQHSHDKLISKLGTGSRLASKPSRHAKSRGFPLSAKDAQVGHKRTSSAMVRHLPIIAGLLFAAGAVAFVPTIHLGGLKGKSVASSISPSQVIDSYYTTRSPFVCKPRTACHRMSAFDVWLDMRSQRRCNLACIWRYMLHFSFCLMPVHQ
jgi:hypothetical protein